MQTSRDGEVRLEGDRKLIEDALASWGSMGNEDSGLGGVVNAVGCVDELAHLQECCPHRALATSDRGPSLAVVKQLVHDHRASQAEKTKFDSADLKKH